MIKFNYILNDLALSSLITKCLYSENANYSDKEELENQIKLIQQENKQLKAQIEEYQKALDETMSEKIDIQNNWNYIKKMLKEARQEKFNIIGYCGTCTDVDIDFLLSKMEELEAKK